MANAPMKADRYYGARAERYEDDRRKSQRWANEQRGIADFVTDGPVLDVPLGTGRYIEIYRTKGFAVTGVDISTDMIAVALRRYPDLDARQGSIFALPFPDGSFATAVCTRLLDWLSPPEMAAAVASLRRVAGTIVVTIRHGVEEIRVNQTHDLASFYRSIDGLLIERRMVTEVTRDGTEELIKARQPTWQDAVGQFVWHSPARGPVAEMQRLADEWVDRMLGAPVPMEPAAVTVSAEFWSLERISNTIDAMARHDDRYATDREPRFKSGFPVVLEADGAAVILDGRQRLNRWRRRRETGQVLVVRPRCSV